MTTNQPRKRGSAIAAIPVAIAVEAVAIAVNVGGAVSAAIAFCLLFATCHQIRLARWRWQRPA